MKYCKFCGAELEDNATVCNKCYKIQTEIPDKSTNTNQNNSYSNIISGYLKQGVSLEDVRKTEVQKLFNIFNIINKIIKFLFIISIPILFIIGAGVCAVDENISFLPFLFWILGLGVGILLCMLNELILEVVFGFILDVKMIREERCNK